VNQLILKTHDAAPLDSILRCAVKFKGLNIVHHHLHHDEPPCFVDDGNVILGLHNIIAHLEDRFPAPPLLIGDPIARSRQRMVCWQLTERVAQNAADLYEVMADFVPYINNALATGAYLTGDKPTIVDVAVAAICDKNLAPFAEFYDIMLGYCRAQTEVA